MHRWIRALATLAATGFLAACGGGGDSVSDQRSVAQNLQSVGSATLMAQAVQASGLAPMLEGNGKYTLLLPDDQALAGSADELRELIASDNKAALQDFVKAHLIEGEVGSKTLAAAADEAQRKQAQAAGQSLPPGSSLSNLLGALLGVTIDAGVVKVNGIAVLGADLPSRNGVLLFIASPLVRPSVFGIVQALPQTSTLEAAIRAAGLVNTLRGAGSYTLFAPTNDAFNRLLSELGLTSAQLLANKPLLTQVLTYHVLASRVLAANIVDGATPVTVQGQAIEFDLVRDARNQLGVKVKDARDRVATVTTTDLRASNGVVHLVDRVFLPSDKTIVGIASGDPQFSILVEAVTAAGLANTLSGPGPFTVFAPTNAAFSALLGELQITKEALLANKPLLTRVLTYHVLPSRSLAASFTNGQVLSPLQGQPLRTAVGSQGISLTDARGRTARVIAANVQATNGVIHAIDRVVLPTDQTLVQVAQSLPQFSILVEAVVAAGLVDVLSSPGPFTVFAPTNDAFVALLGELGLTKAQLLADKALLVKVLTYHVLPAQVLSTQIPFDKPVTTVQGQTLTIGRDLKITDQRTRRAGITATDVAATNGVIHVLDRVILPL